MTGALCVIILFAPLAVLPVAWFLLKTYLIVFVVMWIRWTFPRLRSDQLIKFGWKYLIPAGLANLLLTALAMALWRHP